MHFDTPLIPCTFIQRYKRFLADVRLDDGTEIVAHVANTGSMLGCAVPGSRAALSHHPGKGRRLEWSLELVRPEQSWVCVNTARANGLVEEAIRAGQIPQLDPTWRLRREVRYGRNSRVDLLLEPPEAGACCYVEVKNVTLKQGVAARFPDAVTERGTRHLEELLEVVRRGHRAVLFLLVNREDCDWFEPAREIDPGWAEALERVTPAREGEPGVEVLVWRTALSLESITLSGPVPARWGRHA